MRDHVECFSLLACPAEDGLQTVISIAARPLEHPLADRLERNHQSPRNVPVPKMLVHIVLGSVPGRIQNRNRFGFVRLFERCRTPGPRYVATPTAGSDHEERFTEMRFKTRSGEAAVLRGLWRKENANWRITSYDIEQP